MGVGGGKGCDGEYIVCERDIMIIGVFLCELCVGVGKVMNNWNWGREGMG